MYKYMRMVLPDPHCFVPAVFVCSFVVAAAHVIALAVAVFDDDAGGGGGGGDGGGHLRTCSSAHGVAVSTVEGSPQPKGTQAVKNAVHF